MGRGGGGEESRLIFESVLLCYLLLSVSFVSLSTKGGDTSPFEKGDDKGKKGKIRKNRKHAHEDGRFVLLQALDENSIFTGVCGVLFIFCFS